MVRKIKVSQIDDILMRFIKQGTITIRFKEPPHDLYIKGDVLMLQNFVKTVRLAQQQSPAANTQLSQCVPFSTRTVKKPISRMVVAQKQDYPVLEGFPRTLETLKICGISQSRFDERILLLRRLEVLDLSDNRLTSLPSLAPLSRLHTLALAHNNLGTGDGAWLRGHQLPRSLCQLDLCSNKLSALPEEIYNLVSLVTLKVSDNQLTHLSFLISRLSKLRFLDVSHNNLQSLPCTIRHMKLLEIDVSENKFLHQLHQRKKRKYNCVVPSLIHLSATNVLKFRLPYSAANVPVSIVRFLNGAGYCWCGTAVFRAYCRCFLTFKLDHIPTVRGESLVPLEVHTCSSKCYTGEELFEIGE
ncbi:leucine-rich repeat protein 1-like isoform X2 [Bacillus rossius redtenbacheri]|uniref:leucine-rich repeat protein 1-like isoform X2 n=1 Tax=Bacillus rossius redtenbacheri TaxID=93214 RepID=UPI002FDE85BC